MKTKAKIMIAIGSVAAVVLLAAAIVLGVMASSWYTVITRWWSGTFTTVTTEDGDTALAAQDAAAIVTTETMKEGAVLLKNGSAASGTEFLPKGKEDLGTIALLGYASYSPTKGGAGSVSQGNSGDAIDFYDAFEGEGFTVDRTMREYYAQYGTDNGTTGDMGGGGWGQATGINDGPINDASTEAGAAYTAALGTAAQNASTAVLVFAREGAEGGDLSQDVSEATNCDDGKHYLEFQQTELDLIAYAVENFDNTIVLINSSHVMELGYLDGKGSNSAYDVDAVMLVGGMGDAGALAIPDLITGDSNPSGHLADTYAYDLTTNPSYYSATAGAYDNVSDYEQSFATLNWTRRDGSSASYEYEFNNDVDGGVNYYFEGIYVGYRWYETADAEGFWSGDYAETNWGVSSYDEVVQYPFGYGLSYTSFDWEVTDSSFGDVHGEITVEVRVTNTGDRAGKDVVQLYYSAPYVESENIEKSSKVLGAFVKTDLLDPDESQTYTLTMAVDELASYDYRGYGCYVASAGEYTFTLQTDSHNVKVNEDGSSVEALTMSHDDTWVYDDEGDAEGVTYVGKRSSDETVAKNAFDYASGGDGMIGTYGEDDTPWFFVTRSALEETHPLTTLKGYTVHDYETDAEGDAQYDFKVEMSDEMVNYVTVETLGGSDVPYDHETGTLTGDASYVSDALIPVETGADNGLTLDDVAGYDVWEDEVWDQIVNQMSVDELVLLAENSAYGSPAIDSIGKSMATDVDGPSGISSNNLNYYGNTYTTEPVMAATWNADLLRRIGESVGREATVGGINGWYAPGFNIHRTPFNGRCAEYFSEDPLLAGKLGASEVAGAQSKGLYVFAKHFVANDTDQDRGGMYTWINEQQLREVQLKAFEYPVKEGGALGIMAAYNRIGPSECSVNYGLNTTVLRREWGFKGACLTDGYDYNIGCEKYEVPDLQLRAGGGQLLFIGYDGSNATERPQAYYNTLSTDTEAGIAMLHDLARRIVYRHANSNAMTVTRDYTPYWLGILIPLMIVLVAGAVCCVIFLVVRPILKSRKADESGAVS